MARNWEDPLDTTPPSQGALTWSDYGNMLASGVVGIGAQIAGAAEAMPTALNPASAIPIEALKPGNVRRSLQNVQGAIQQGYSPAAAGVAASSLLPGEGEKSWSDVGVGRAIAFKGTGALPSLVATIIPAGIAFKGLQALGLGRGAALAGAGIAGRVTEAALNAGDVAGSIYKTVEDMSDEDLQLRSPAYSFYRSTMGPEAARDRYKREVASYAPAAAAVVTMLMGGAETQLVRKILGGSGLTGGIVKRAAKGAGLEAVEEVAQTGTAATATEDVLARAGIKDERDWRDAIAQTLESGVIGSVLGGSVGAIAKDSGHEAVQAKIGVGATPPASTVAPTASPASPAAARPQPAVTPRVSATAAATGAATQQPAPAQAPLPPKPTQVAPQAAPGPAAPPPTTVELGDPQNKPKKSKRRAPAAPNPAPNAVMTPTQNVARTVTSSGITTIETSGDAGAIAQSIAAKTGGTVEVVQPAAPDAAQSASIAKSIPQQPAPPAPETPSPTSTPSPQTAATAPAPAPAAPAPTPSTAQGPPPSQSSMPSPEQWEEIRQHFDYTAQPVTAEDAAGLLRNVKELDDNIARAVLPPDQAEQYIKASPRQKDALLEGMTVEQANALTGVNQPRMPQEEELRDLADALSAVEHSQEEMVDELVSHITQLPPEGTPPDQWGYRQRIANAVFNRAADVANESGYDTSAITQEVIKRTASKFPDPEDAMLFLRRFLKKGEQGAPTSAISSGPLALPAPAPAPVVPRRRKTKRKVAEPVPAPVPEAAPVEAPVEPRREDFASFAEYVAARDEYEAAQRRAAMAPAAAPVEAAQPRVLAVAPPEEIAALAAEREQEIAAQRVAEEETQVVKEKKPGHKGKAAKAQRIKDNQTAATITEQHPPTNAEGQYANYTHPRGQAARAQMQGRARRMVEAAEAFGVKIPGKLYENVDPKMTPSDAMLLLMEAKALAKKKEPEQEDFDRFVQAETDIRYGNPEDARKRRREEGEAKKRVSQGNVEERAAGAGAATEQEAARAEAAEEAVGEPEAEGAEETGEPEAEAAGQAPAISKEDVETKVSATARMAPKVAVIVEQKKVRTKSGVERQLEVSKAAAPARSVSEEERAKIAARLAAEGKLTPKVSEVKAKVEAKPKPADTVARVKEAAKKAERAPSDAKREAGNYKMGHTSIQGIPITIEGDKGTVRKGTDPQGREWEARRPAIQGHVKSVRGADGENLDVWIGPRPDSPTVVVIDQRNLETGAFDEHKVMLGFANLRAALETYESTFSDGRGRERVMDSPVKTVDEFKEWLKGDTTKPAGETPAAAAKEEAKATPPVLDPEAIVASGRRTGRVHHAQPPIAERLRQVRESGRELQEWLEAEALDSASLNEILDSVASQLTKKKGSQLTQKYAKFYPAIINKIKPLVENVKVYVISTDQLNMIIPNQQAELLGFYVLGTDMIVLDEKIFNELGLGSHVILHEAVHAAFMKATYESPIVRAQLEAILAEAKEAWKKHGRGDLYALTNIDELLAEALTDLTTQQVLMITPAPANLVDALKLGRITTVWDALVALVKKALGLNNVPNSAFEAVMKVVSRLELGAIAFNEKPISDAALQARLLRDVGAVAPFIPARAPGPMTEQLNTPRLLRLRGMDQMAQLAKDFFDKTNPVRKVANLVERIRIRGKELLEESEPVIRDLYLAERKFKGERWDNFVAVLHDETMSGVYADRSLKSQKHLGKKAMKGRWARNQHADLSARYQQHVAPYPELVKVRNDAMKLFTDRQNEMSYWIIENILQTAGKFDRSLATRLWMGKATDLDKKVLGDLYDDVIRARELRKLDGPYFPLMRRGKYVVQARYVIDPPTNALRQHVDNKGNPIPVWDFTDRAAAEAFTDKQRLETRAWLTSTWVHKNTLQTHVTHQGKQVRITKNDADAIQLFRVRVQDRHMEMVETQQEALMLDHQLRNTTGVAKDSVLTEVRKDDPSGGQAGLMSYQMEAVWKRLNAMPTFTALDPARQAQMKKVLTEASIRMLGSTRVQTHRLPRQYVAGASRDLTRNTHEYAVSTSGYIARLQLQRQLDNAVGEMEEAVRTTPDQTRSRSIGRSAIAKEVKSRVHNVQSFEDFGVWGEWSNRIATASYINYLLSPAYSMVQALQPAMLTAPILSSRHGTGTAIREMFRTYDAVGARALTKQGIRATSGKIKGGQLAEVGSIIDVLRSNVSDPNERKVIDYLIEHGSIGRGAGFEVSGLIQARSDNIIGATDRALGYMQSLSMQMPLAVETINRAVTGLAAYRLELKKTGNHEQAMLYAQEVTNLTQGLYSHTDAPPIFNNPWARLSLQFKKYAQLYYGLIGHQVGKAIRNVEPGDRAEALKALAYIGASHILLAGLLGLPTEPVKYFLTGLNMAGITDYTWQDFENSVREMTAYFGPGIGELISRGLPRALGIDLSGRVGAADLLFFGEPRSSDPHDIFAFFGQIVAGAPGSMLIDTLQGSNKIMSGDLAGGAEQIAPVKVLSDSIRAYNRLSEGKRTAAGYEAMSPYGPLEVATRVIGFTPGREAETQEQRAYFRHAETSMNQERNAFQRQWATGDANKRARLWGKIEEWNRGRPREEKLTRSDLEEYRRRRKREERKYVKQGFRITDRDRALYGQTLGTYNVTP